MSANGHLWIVDKEGKVREDLADYEHHSGPVCLVCGYSYCVYCHPKGAPEPCPYPAKTPEPRTTEAL